MNLRPLTVLCALGALAIPATASATDATISPTAKKTTITGTISDPAFGAYDLALFFYGGTEVRGQSACVAPLCEEHHLTVADGAADLKLDATSDASNLSLEIKDPSGAMTEVNEVEATAEHHLTLDPTAGQWTIRVYGSAESDTFDYSLAFRLRTPEDVLEEDGPPSDGF